MDKNLSESFKILISKQMATCKTWTQTLDPDPGPCTLHPGPGPWTLDPDTGPDPEKPGP